MEGTVPALPLPFMAAQPQPHLQVMSTACFFVYWNQDPCTRHSNCLQDSLHGYSPTPTHDGTRTPPIHTHLKMVPSSSRKAMACSTCSSHTAMLAPPSTSTFVKTGAQASVVSRARLPARPAPSSAALGCVKGFGRCSLSTSWAATDAACKWPQHARCLPPWLHAAPTCRTNVPSGGLTQPATTST